MLVESNCVTSGELSITVTTRAAQNMGLKNWLDFELGFLKTVKITTKSFNSFQIYLYSNSNCGCYSVSKTGIEFEFEWHYQINSEWPR